MFRLEKRLTLSDVNKDLGLKAKAKDLSHKAKAKDSDPKVKAKDLGPKAKAKDSRYQGPIFHRSSPYIICSSLTLCACFMFAYYILSVYE